MLGGNDGGVRQGGPGQLAGDPENMEGECERPERAIAIAARLLDAQFDAVEVRPVMDLSGMEM